MHDFCRHDCETFGPIECWQILEYLSDCWLLKGSAIKLPVAQNVGKSLSK
jgi:hypothetical protein